MASFDFTDKKKPLVEYSLAGLADIILLLLIFFLLTSSFVTQFGINLQDDSCPPEVQRYGRTITRWRHQISAWHRARHTN